MDNTNPKKTVILVSHTHWDREWYQPFQQYRLKLLRVIDRVLAYLQNNESFKHFLLDGQAIILEDYLEIHPEKADLIKMLVEQGKLSIGPWYILPDEFLVNGESMVRNLLQGHLLCRDFGAAQKIGYMPDSFGHFAQLPQILQKGGIDAFVYTRGNGDEIDDLGAEYYWQAPDGSAVLAIQQLDGYCNAGGLGSADILDVYEDRPIDPELAVRQFGRLLDRMRTHANGEVYLFNNGCDHFPPQADLEKIMDLLKIRYPDVEVIHGSLDDYIGRIRTDLPELKSYTGELLSGKYHHILSGVWSARMYLKQMNCRCQNLLTRYTEPVMSLLHFMFGQSYPDEVISYCWKSLLKNHPHDSICGCSVDEVHREMITRFEAVLQTGSAIVGESLKALFRPLNTGDQLPVLTLVNPLTYKRTVLVDRYFVLPKGLVADHPGIIDERGRRITALIIETLYTEDFWLVDFSHAESLEEQQAMLDTFRTKYPRRFRKRQNKARSLIPLVRLQFMAVDMPACGLINYRIITDGTEPIEIKSPEPVHCADNKLENAYYSITLRQNGMFDLLDKSNGINYKDLHLFEDTEDVGDEYDYAPVRQTQTITSQSLAGEVTIVNNSRLRGTIRAGFEMTLPVAVTTDRSRRQKQKTKCLIETYITLEADSRLIQIRTKIDNKARDHRLRVLFQTGIRSAEVISDGHYYLNHRPVKQAEVSDWKQPPTGTYPQQEFSLVEGNRTGFILLNKGLPEFATLVSDDGKVTMAITLLRAVEWLSRDDLSTRKGNAGPMLYTPEAQCIGEHIVEYAISTYTGNYLDAGIGRLADHYYVPVYVRPHKGIPAGSVSNKSLLWTESEYIRVTALKKHHKRNTLICRMYNLSSLEQTALVGSDLDMSGVWRIDLLEDREKSMALSGQRNLAVRLKPYEIVTIEIEFTGRIEIT